MKTDKAKCYLEQATARVEEEDRHLLEIDVSERCIAARLAMYLREYFYNYHVDVEYNRDGEDKKKLHDLVYKHDCYRARDDEGQRVLPDVIVHKRGNNNSNLLVIEMKKLAAHQADIEKDKLRIRVFRKELDYKFGALVVCETKGNPTIYVKEWEDGEEGIPQSPGA